MQKGASATRRTQHIVLIALHHLTAPPHPVCRPLQLEDQGRLAAQLQAEREERQALAAQLRGAREAAEAAQQRIASLESRERRMQVGGGPWGSTRSGLLVRARLAWLGPLGTAAAGLAKASPDRAQACCPALTSRVPGFSFPAFLHRTTAW